MAVNINTSPTTGVPQAQLAIHAGRQDVPIWQVRDACYPISVTWYISLNSINDYVGAQQHING